MKNLQYSKLFPLGLKLEIPPLFMLCLFETLSALPYELSIMDNIHLLLHSVIMKNLQYNKLFPVGLKLEIPPLFMLCLFETLSALPYELNIMDNIHLLLHSVIMKNLQYSKLFPPELKPETTPLFMLYIFEKLNVLPHELDTLDNIHLLFCIVM